MVLLAAAALIGSMQISTGTLVRPDVKLPYTIIGKGKPTLALSGGPGFTTDYLVDMLKPSKAKNIQWIFLEQRGTPRARLAHPSEKNLAVSEYVADLEALRKKLGLKRWNVLGQSWGTVLAHAYVAAHPDRVSSLVLLGDVGPDATSLIAASDNADRALTPEERAEEARMGGTSVEGPADDDAALKLFLIQLPAFFYSREAAMKAKELFPTGCLVGATENFVLPALLKDHWDVSKSIGRYKGPAIVIQGRQDFLGESPVWKDKIAMPQTQIVFLERAGHIPWTEAAGPFYKALDAFLNRETK